MERKRKLPPRAAARTEQVTKKRTTTSPESSVTPAPQPTPVPEPSVAAMPELPTTIQSGTPLPTVEKPQAQDLPSTEYQSVQESGVLAESLTRSRQKWIHEGIFEKYWTKPTKRKGVVNEAPNNPPKESMTKVGGVTITVEPHVFEATMYIVKDPKPPVTASNSTSRPVMQYGPPNGVMPPPPPPKSKEASTPTQPKAGTVAAAVSNSQSPVPQGTPSNLAQPPSVTGTPQPQSQQLQAPTDPSHNAASGIPVRPPSSSTGIGSVLAPPQQSPGPSPVLANPATAAASVQQQPPQPGQSPSTPAPQQSSGAKPPTPGSKPATPAQPGADPIIVTLAEKASEDPHLRDLMKRVAIGDASPSELTHFQKIIDQITVEYKKKGGQQGPSADRLLVDGKTVKSYASEVHNIIGIILRSNPNQRSVDLRAPPNSDPLMFTLVKRCLDDKHVRELVRRVAENQTRFSDATELKGLLDKSKEVVKEMTKLQQGASPKPAPVVTGQPADAINVSNGNTPQRKQSVSAVSQSHSVTSQQALRSKGPPPLKYDIAALILEFPGGTGDRYLFPKYSILEYPSNSEVIASFLIVRKGSKSEYGGDPELDYYQPVTIRITSTTPKYLENFARVVAHQEEVRRYMDDVMDNMTRAEYILLAMRLPKADKEDQSGKEKEASGTPIPDTRVVSQPQGVLWTKKSTPSHTSTQRPTPKVLGEEEQYQNFIASVS